MAKQVTKQENKKQAFTLHEVLAMWKQTSKDGKAYFTGKTSDGKKLVGFYNTKKKNPKEPDIRIYTQTEMKTEAQPEPMLSLWADVSKGGKKYLSGKWDGKRVVGFISDKADEKRPYFRVYLSEDAKPEAKVEQQELTAAASDNDGDLPF